MQKKVSAIIPIKLTSDSLFRVERVKNILREGSSLASIDFVVVDSSEPQHAWPLRALCELFGASYEYYPLKGPYSPGTARNIGLRRARADIVLFLDADLQVTSDFYTRILQLSDTMRAADERHVFHSIPCLYLNQGHKAPSPRYFKDLLQMAFQRHEDISHIAIATSTLLVWKSHMQEIGGFSERFMGYGCEDLELLHRLATLYPLGRRCEDYDRDDRSKKALDQKGYRHYFSYYCVPLLFEGIYTVHLWHERPLTRAYYRCRKDNEIIFKEARDRFDLLHPLSIAKQQDLPELPPMRNYLARRQESLYQDGIDLDFSIHRVQSGFTRKFRKLVLHPKLFVRDYFQKKARGQVMSAGLGL